MAFRAGRSHAEPEPLLAGTVSSLATKGAQGERVVVYLDGRRAFDLDAAVAAGAGLRKEQLLTEEEQAALLKEDEPHRARSLAMVMLARRELSEQEVAAKLRGAGVSESGVSDTLEWLRDRGYVDDSRYAVAYAAARTRAGWGRQRIVSDLLKKGIEREVVKACCSAADPQVPEQAEAYGQLVEMVSHRFSAQLVADPLGARRRISGYLARRGHGWDVIGAVLRSLRETESLEVDDGEWAGPE